VSYPADPDRACPHPDFIATVEVGRIAADDEHASDDDPAQAFTADVRVHCASCDEPFRWTGLEVGMSFDHPMVSIDGLELRAPLRPASSDDDFGMGLPSAKAGTEVTE
jgi:hypothetical protein